MKFSVPAFAIFGILILGTSAKAEDFHHPHEKWYQDHVSWQNNSYRRLRPSSANEQRAHEREYASFVDFWTQAKRALMNEEMEIRRSIDCRGYPSPIAATNPKCQRADEIHARVLLNEKLASQYVPLRFVQTEKHIEFPAIPFGSPEEYKRRTGRVFDQDAEDQRMAAEGAFRSYDAYLAYHSQKRQLETKPLQPKSVNPSGQAHNADISFGDSKTK